MIIMENYIVYNINFGVFFSIKYLTISFFNFRNCVIGQIISYISIYGYPHLHRYNRVYIENSITQIMRSYRSKKEK